MPQRASYAKTRVSRVTELLIIDREREDTGTHTGNSRCLTPTMPMRLDSDKTIRRIIRWIRRAQRGFRTRTRNEVTLAFQASWAPIFLKHRDRVEAYWLTRGLDRVIKTVRPAGKRILNVGCGISTVLHFIEGERYGIDPLVGEYHRFYRCPEGIRVVAASGEALPFADASFGVVFCTNVLDHTASPDRVVTEIRRVLQHWGFFVLTVDVFDTRMPRGRRHPHTFTTNDVDRLVGVFEPIWHDDHEWIGLQAYARRQSGKAQLETVRVLRKS